MQGKQKPIIVVDERRLNLFIHVDRLAVELRLKIGRLYRIAVPILSLIGNLAGLRLPLPHVRSLEKSGDLTVPCIADRLDFPERIETIGLGNLFENWWTILCPAGAWSNDKHRKNETTDP